MKDETNNHYVRVGNRHVPVIAFFGTKGGVGKTTIVNKFSSLVSRADSAPNVLMVDFDIHHRGLTVIRTKDRSEGCRTIHEYLYDDQLKFEKAQDVTPQESSGSQGREYLIPSSNPAADNVFKSLTRMKPHVLVERLTKLLNEAAEAYNISLVLIDCGPIVDPLTASAAFMSDDAFIIGQNEPITFRSLQSYASRIHEFLPEFNASNVRVILNKVRGYVSQKTGIYAVIPFTMEVVDLSEGLANIDEVRLVFLDDCIRNLIKDIFKQRYEELVPNAEATLTDDQRNAIDLIDQYTQTAWYRQRKKRSMLLYIGVPLLLAGIVMLALFGSPAQEPAEAEHTKKYIAWALLLGGIALSAAGAWFYSLRRLADTIIRIKEGAGCEGLLALCTTKTGRKKYDEMRKLSMKSEKEL